MIAMLFLGLLVLGSVLWVLLDRHESRRAAGGLPRHSAMRLVFAAAAALLILFSGGCGLLFLANMDGMYVTWQAVAFLTLPPLAVGLLAWWLAIRRNKV